MSNADTHTILVTGFPSFLVKRFCRQTLRRRPGARLLLLHTSDVEAQAQSFVDGLAEDPELADGAARIELLRGAPFGIDLGLSSADYQRLRTITEIQHLAWDYRPEGEFESPRRGAQATREVLELAVQCADLRRFVHWSSVTVTGDRTGVVLEEELPTGQRFHNAAEANAHESESLVRRARGSLPITVLRTGVIVGDSETGAIAPYPGPHNLIRALLRHRPDEPPVVLPGSGNAPVHLVPIDFVIRAGHFLSLLPDARGKTYHLVDPCPLPARRVYQLVTAGTDRRPLTVPRVPGPLLRFLRGVAPVMERLAPYPVLHPEIFDRLVFYNCSNTHAALEGSGIRCPPFAAYVQRLVAFARKQQDKTPPERAEVERDPLA